jgi:hypothetical protein
MFSTSFQWHSGGFYTSGLTPGAGSVELATGILYSGLTTWCQARILNLESVTQLLLACVSVTFLLGSK